MIIESGTGNGRLASVDIENRLSVASFNLPFQNVIAKDYQKTFQVWGTANLASGTVTPLHIKNNSSDKVLVLNYLRWQIIDNASGTALPSATNYMTFGYGPSYLSGGTTVVPTNMSSGSSVLSSMIAYGNNPTLNGVATVFDRHYPQAEGDMYTYVKDGAAQILAGNNFVAQYVGNHTSGIVYVRASVVEVSVNGFSA